MSNSHIKYNIIAIYFDQMQSSGILFAYTSIECLYLLDNKVKLISGKILTIILSLILLVNIPFKMKITRMQHIALTFTYHLASRKENFSVTSINIFSSLFIQLREKFDANKVLIWENWIEKSFDIK